jgi:phenylpyruvate tautomerase PptA (4-oxalocrotonate tautomerase family)
MPYLQIDVHRKYPAAVKQQLAQRFGAIYSQHMQANVRRISVAIRELEDGLWRCTDHEPYAAALIMCDIRKGRPPEQRAGLAAALVETTTQLLELRIDQVNVEFTQHSGDEMYHPLLGGLSDDWQASEAGG